LAFKHMTAVLSDDLSARLRVSGSYLAMEEREAAAGERKEEDPSMKPTLINLLHGASLHRLMSLTDRHHDLTHISLRSFLKKLVHLKVSSMRFVRERGHEAASGGSKLALEIHDACREALGSFVRLFSELARCGATATLEDFHAWMADAFFDRHVMESARDRQELVQCLEGNSALCALLLGMEGKGTEALVQHIADRPKQAIIALDGVDNLWLCLVHLFRCGSFAFEEEGRTRLFKEVVGKVRSAAGKGKGKLFQSSHFALCKLAVCHAALLGSVRQPQQQ